MATLKLKEASEYSGLTAYRLRQLALQKKIPHLKAGNRYLFRTETLDKWLEEQEKLSVEPDKEEPYGVLRKIKEK